MAAKTSAIVLIALLQCLGWAFAYQKQGRTIEVVSSFSVRGRSAAAQFGVDTNLDPTISLVDVTEVASLNEQGAESRRLSRFGMRVFNKQQLAESGDKRCRIIGKHVVLSCDLNDSRGKPCACEEGVLASLKSKQKLFMAPGMSVPEQANCFSEFSKFAVAATMKAFRLYGQAVKEKFGKHSCSVESSNSETKKTGKTAFAQGISALKVGTFQFHEEVAERKGSYMESAIAKSLGEEDQESHPATAAAVQESVWNTSHPHHQSPVGYTCAGTRNASNVSVNYDATTKCMVGGNYHVYQCAMKDGFRKKKKCGCDDGLVQFETHLSLDNDVHAEPSQQRSCLLDFFCAVHSGLITKGVAEYAKTMLSTLKTCGVLKTGLAEHAKVSLSKIAQKLGQHNATVRDVDTGVKTVLNKTIFNASNRS